MRNIIVICNSPVLSLRISMYLETRKDVSAVSYHSVESASLEKHFSSVDCVIAVSSLHEFDDIARVAKIRKLWNPSQIVMVTNVDNPRQMIYRHKKIHDVSYFFWYFDSREALKKLVQDDLDAVLADAPIKTITRIPLSEPKMVQGLDRLKPAVVLIGASTGGFAALRKLVSTLPTDFRAPIIIVQHIPKGFDGTLLRSLTGISHMAVELATDGMHVQNRHIYIAPYDFHLYVDQRDDGLVLRLDQAPVVHSLRPSVDPLFSSAASIQGYRVIATIMTGMGSDGTLGGKLLHQAGATIVCQDQASSTVWGMARTAIESGICHKEASLDELGQVLFEYSK